MLIYLPSRTRYEIAAERAAAALGINYLTYARIARTGLTHHSRGDVTDVYVVGSSSKFS